MIRVKQKLQQTNANIKYSNNEVKEKTKCCIKQGHDAEDIKGVSFFWLLYLIFAILYLTAYRTKRRISKLKRALILPLKRRPR